MQHFVIIGFKHVGKSTIGRKLSVKLQLPFVDLDEAIMAEYQKIFSKKLSCREIVNQHSENFFRKLEQQTLQNTLNSKKQLLIAVGGGTPVSEKNRKIMETHQIILIEAAQKLIYKRIMLSGKPAFFTKGQSPLHTFQKLWNERLPVFKNLAKITIENNGDLDESIEKLYQKIITNA